jgi:hypothetical protein
VTAIERELAVATLWKLHAHFCDELSAAVVAAHEASMKVEFARAKRDDVLDVIRAIEKGSKR